MAELSAKEKKEQALKALSLIIAQMKGRVGDPTLLLQTALDVIREAGLGTEFINDIITEFNNVITQYQIIQSIRDVAYINNVKSLEAD